MRRIAVLLTLFALAAPLAAFAGPRVAGDGTIAVRDLNGFFSVAARGATAGRCDRCFLRIEERNEDSPIDPLVFGARAQDLDGDGETDRYRVRDGRWKIIGGNFFVRVSGATDADISIVGRGFARLRGTGGTYSVNGGDFLAVPTELTRVDLRAPTP
jgi:hypothetical protein